MVKPTLLPENIDQKQAMWAVFSDDTDIKVLKILKRGFRHCFLIIKMNEQWILIDPRANKTDFDILSHPSHFNLPRFLISEGKTVVKVPFIQTPKRIAPLFPMSCVESVKRLIGIHSRWVLTPHHLYQYLNKRQKRA